MAQPTGISIHPETGNVGIGVVNASSKLQVNGHITPSSCNVYDLGSSQLRFRDLYLSGSTIDLGGTKISRDENGGGIRLASASGETVDSRVKNLFADGTITASNLNIVGDYVTMRTTTSNTEQMVIENAGTGPALKVTQTGANSIAEFYDDGGVLALKIADGGNVGIGTDLPLAPFHVIGTVQATGFSGSGASITSIDATNITAGNLAVARGGTGATTLTANKVLVGNGTTAVLQPTNLHWDDSNGRLGIGTTTPRADIDIAGTGAMIIPTGSTDQLPLIPIIGMIRFNTTTSRLQYYTQVGWASIGGITATGGTPIDIGSYRIHTFTSSGTLTMVTGGQIDYLVCAGGGGGGCDRAGGGGAGGLLFGQTYITSGTYAITIGGGGSGATTDSVKGGNGTNSSLGNLWIAIGGGGGGSENSKQGNNGGSGGGNSYALATLSSGTAGQGNAGGGDGGDSPNRRTGGGGGAGGAGTVPNGGVGILSSITGTSLAYAGGGGGGSCSGDGGGSSGTITPGIGGSEIGGSGGTSSNDTSAYGQNGVVNRGGGGGGGGGSGSAGSFGFDSARGGNGGSGIVIIRYLL